VATERRGPDVQDGVPDVALLSDQDGEPDVELFLEASDAGLLASAAVDGDAEARVAALVEAADDGVTPDDALAFARVVRAAAAIYLGRAADGA
jgi:hypothetical protein